MLATSQQKRINDLFFSDFCIKPFVVLWLLNEYYDKQEDSDVMLHSVTFHQGLYSLLKQSSEMNIYNSILKLYR